MREIKFRGKHLEPGGTWIYGNLVVCENGDCLIGHCKEYGPEARYMRNEVYPDSVGQYTGIKDKNGKEIYEGDILSINVAGVVTKRTKVVFENGIFGVHWKSWNSPDNEINSFNCFCNTEFEVLGNIFENPELLGDEIE